MIDTLRELYFAETERARRFRYGLLVFDVVTVLFVIATSFAPLTPAIEVIDAVFGLAILADFLARLALARLKWRFLVHPLNIADLVAIVSFLAPIAGEGLGFLRILRTVRLLSTYHMLAQLRQDFDWFRRYEEVVFAALNMVVFLFIMTGVVYETQHWRNPDIGNYADALYFTVTALTTTGFGDITLEGTAGRMLTVVIMIVGVTLFLRLAQVLFRPNKVRFECPTCGLSRHDHDAVHCKACGTVLKIPDEGAD
jgi:voltage-gated potassium channel